VKPINTHIDVVCLIPKDSALDVGAFWYLDVGAITAAHPALLLQRTHNAANEYLGLIERAENGAPRACANWTAPSSGQ
jgi:hypothetical protein